jgi:hypothetical protein
LIERKWFPEKTQILTSHMFNLDEKMCMIYENKMEEVGRVSLMKMYKRMEWTSVEKASITVFEEGYDNIFLSN